MVNSSLSLSSSSCYDFPGSLPHASHWPVLSLTATTTVTQAEKCHLGHPWAQLPLRGALLKSKSAAESWTSWLVASRRKGGIALEVNYELPFKNLFVEKDEDSFLPQPSALRLRIHLRSSAWSSLFCLVLFFCVLLSRCGLETELVDEEGDWNKHDWRSRRIRVERREGGSWSGQKKAKKKHMVKQLFLGIFRLCFGNCTVQITESKSVSHSVVSHSLWPQ